MEMKIPTPGKLNTQMTPERHTVGRVPTHQCGRRNDRAISGHFEPDEFGLTSGAPAVESPDVAASHIIPSCLGQVGVAPGVGAGMRLSDGAVPSAASA